MGATRNLEEKPSYEADSGVAFDSEGYCISPGADGDDTIKKASGTENFIGVNTISTKNQFDTEVRAGEPVALHMEGEVNVLCAAGAKYNLGDAVYLSGTAGVADNSSTGNTRIGTVAQTEDLTGAAGPELVAVNITGYV